MNFWERDKGAILNASSKQRLPADLTLAPGIEASQVAYCSCACDRKVRDLEYIIVREGFHCS